MWIGTLLAALLALTVSRQGRLIARIWFDGENFPTESDSLFALNRVRSLGRDWHYHLRHGVASLAGCVSLAHAIHDGNREQQGARFYRALAGDQCWACAARVRSFSPR
jgi:hypothetical protein